MAQIPNELVDALERLGAQTTGDVGALIAQARAQAPGPFGDDRALASALEAAAIRRAAAGDRNACWWLSCAIATLRASPIASPQEEAEVLAARLFGELAQSPAARGAIPEAARWIVAGYAEPPPVAATIELARRNGLAHIERLSNELVARGPVIRSRIEAARGDAPAKHAIEEAIAGYDLAAVAARAALSRVIDHVVGRSGDLSLLQAGTAALAELDEQACPALHARTIEARHLLGAYGSNAGASTFLDGGGGADRPSFAGAAPPSFRAGKAAPSGVASTAMSLSTAPASLASGPPSREMLEAEMRAAFERAWTSPTAESRTAFINAVRARYALETSSIADPEQRQRALDHYVAHALAQLPPA